MAFKRQTPALDLETTAIENIFLTEFMPMADGNALKVYLLGYRYACDPENHSRFTNEALARHLNLQVSDVKAAWDFWADRGLIRKHEAAGSDYTVEFVSLRQLYIDSNFMPRQTPSEPRRKSPTPERLTDSLKEPALKQMFREVETLLGRPLEPNDCLEILEWVDGLGVEPTTILKAFEFVVREKNIRNIRYVGSVLRSWTDQGGDPARKGERPAPKAPVKTQKPNRFHNFEGRLSKLSDQELEELIHNRKTRWSSDKGENR